MYPDATSSLPALWGSPFGAAKDRNQPEMMGDAFLDS
jgi:hypothetical protein